jgi:hypothetical protein
MNNLPKKPETETETKVAVKSKKYSIKQHQLHLLIFLVVIFLPNWTFSLRFTKHRMERRSGRLVGEHLQPSEPSAKTH